jgi:hypothetical protein
MTPSWPGSTLDEPAFIDPPRPGCLDLQDFCSGGLDELTRSISGGDECPAERGEQVGDDTACLVVYEARRLTGGIGTSATGGVAGPRWVAAA